MYIYLFLCLFCAALGSTNADDSLDSDIEKLPTEVKKQLYERIARRIFNEVKVKKLSNASEVLVTKDQLQEQDAFIKKLLKEEQKKLRRSYIAKNATKEKLQENKNNPNKKNETGNKKEDTKDHLRNEKLNSNAMGFIDLTKRSIPKRRSGDSKNANSTIYTVKPIKEDNEEETSTVAQNSITVSENENYNISDSASNITETNSNGNSSNDTQNIAIDSTASSNSDNASHDTKEQTMIQIDSLPDGQKNDNEEGTHEFRTKDLEGEHVVKYVNISLLKSGVENQTAKNLNEDEINPELDQNEEVDMLPETKTNNLSVLETTEKTSPGDANTTSVSDNNDTSTIKSIIISKDLSESNANTETTTTQAENTTTKAETTTETAQNKTEEKSLEMGPTKRSNNEELSINIKVEPHQQETETTTVFVQKIDTAKPKDDPNTNSNETKQDINVNVALSLGDQTPKTHPTIIDAQSGDELKEEIKVNNKSDSVAVELREVRDRSQVITSSNKDKIYNVGKQEIHQTSKKNYDKILQSGKYVNPDPYYVFEAPAGKEAFDPIVVLPSEPKSEPENIEEPEIVPVHDYEPANAYYNPHNTFIPDDEDEKLTIYNGDASIVDLNESPIYKHTLPFKTFDFTIEEPVAFFTHKRDELPIKPISYDVESIDSMNEEPQMVPIHNYDPANAYYNPSKFYDPASKENTPVHVYPQETKNNAKKEFNKKLQNTQISSGNPNDIIFEALNFPKNKQSDFGKKEPNEDNDNYILNFLKEKHRSTKALFLNPQKPNPKLYDDDVDDEFVVIQDIIAQNKKPHKPKHEKGVSQIRNNVLDTLFKAKNKLAEIPKRQEKSNDGLAGLKRFLSKYLKSNNMLKSVESFGVSEPVVSATKPTKKQESAFLSIALEELFKTPTNFGKSNPQKSSNKKRDLREDIALDYYFEREDIPRSVENYNDASESNNNDNLPYWRDSSSKERAQLNRKIQKKLAIYAPKVAALGTKENETVYSILKKYLQPLETSVEGGENTDEACAIKKSVQVYLNVLQDMIDTNSDALVKFDWLGTTVDIEASLEKLEELSEKSLKNEKLQEKDYQLFKFFVYLHKLSDEKMKSRPKCDDDQSQEVYRYDQNDNEELVIAPRDYVTLKRKKGVAAVDTFKLFNDYFKNLYKFKRRTADVIDDYSDIDNLYEFATALRDDMYELHMAIKNVASITEYSSQNWYRDLKNIFLKSAKRKYLLAALLHITFTRVLDIVEVAIADGADKNYVEYIVEHVDDFENLIKKTEFLKAIMQEMSAL